MDVREILRHPSRGQSQRTVCEALGIGRNTVGRYYEWAQAQGSLTDPPPPPSKLNHLLEEALVGASFGDPLEHEPKGSILRAFDLAVIWRTFPSYEREIGGRL